MPAVRSPVSLEEWKVAKDGWRLTGNSVARIAPANGVISLVRISGSRLMCHRYERIITACLIS